jgi:flagellar FliJ protein
MFTFTLEPLLAQRQDREERHRSIVATRARAFEVANAALEALSAQHRRHCSLLAGNRRSREAEMLRVQYAHLEALERQLEAARRVLAQRAMDVESARVELRAAAKERKALEKLKERRFQEYAAKRARAEALEFDDANARLPRCADLQEDAARRQ